MIEGVGEKINNAQNINEGKFFNLSINNPTINIAEKKEGRILPFLDFINLSGWLINIKSFQKKAFVALSKFSIHSSFTKGLKSLNQSNHYPIFLYISKSRDLFRANFSLNTIITN